MAMFGHYATLCKFVSLGQKLKFSKISKKLLYNCIRAALCKKQLSKTQNIRKVTSFPTRSAVTRGGTGYKQLCIEA